VSEEEIKSYLSNTNNQKLLESAYEENKAIYNKPEEIKARHILVKGDDAKNLDKLKAIKAKLNAGNFASVAGKETEDPSGKSTGGELGWFARGKMVPEFEDVAFNLKKGQISEPVKTQFGYHLIFLEDKKEAQVKTLDDVKADLARIAIQKTKAQDLDQLLKTEQENIMGLLKDNKVAELEALQKKLDAQFFKNTDINQFDQTIGQLTLSPKEAEEVFKSNPGDILNFGNAGTIYLVKANSKLTIADKKTDEQLPNEKSTQNQSFSRKVREELLKNLNNKAKIVTNPGLI
jgi:peptidyl-prolyl cis-trans isomerase D